MNSGYQKKSDKIIFNECFGIAVTCFERWYPADISNSNGLDTTANVAIKTDDQVRTERGLPFSFSNRS